VTASGSERERVFDVVVVGAGPAGMAAAQAAAGLGAGVAVIDRYERPGGQFYRQRTGGNSAAEPRPWPGRPGAQRRPAPERPWRQGAGSAAAGHARIGWLERGGDGVCLFGGTNVWHAERGRARGFLLHCERASGAGVTAFTVTGRAVVLATGAHDVALPVPGWELPGVLTAGGAQALIKGTGTLPGTRFLVAGAGPFLLPVAASILAGGGAVAAVVDAAAPGGWLRHLPAVAGSPAKLAEAARYAALLARHRVPLLTRRAVTAVGGAGRVAWADVDQVDGGWRPAGRPRRVEADTVCLSFGFVPSAELALALGCGCSVGGAVPSAVADVDGDMWTGQPGIYAAGELTGVGGASLAEAEGFIAGTSAALAAGRPAGAVGARRHRALHAQRRRALRFAAALDDVYGLRPGWMSWVTPETVVCRCEEVTAGAARRAVAEYGVTSERTLKMVSRVGMGRCQGRMCGHLTPCLIEAGERTAAAFAKRLIASPVTVESIIGPKGAPSTVLQPSLSRLAVELAPRRIRVNAAAELIDTAGTRASGFVGSAAANEFAQAIPLQRMGTPDDVAAVVTFLASARCDDAIPTVYTGMCGLTTGITRMT
jgi:NADPH-dependent 2,4-dienoyl-CoA reductase/sulfur reductase-like enzyme